MINEEASQIFSEAGLTYADITEGDICVLVMMLNRHVKEACKRHKMSVNSMRMSEKIRSKYTSHGKLIECCLFINSKHTTHGKLIECYLYINSHYFTQREAISFNKNGFISFANWADERNTEPLRNAFVEWVKGMTESKEGKVV